MQLMIVVLVFAAGLALAYAAFNFFAVKKLPEGNERMQEIASAIRVGANAFLDYEYRVLYQVIFLVAVPSFGHNKSLTTEPTNTI